MIATKKILVVDDEPVITKSCRRILSDCGFEVETAGSGTDGLRRAGAKDFDLVITDLKMPDMNGLDLVRRIRQERPQTAIVIITGFGSASTAVEAMRLGVLDYIEKPFSIADITAVVEKALGAVPSSAPPKSSLIEADLVREVLRAASSDTAFGARLLREGSKVLSGHALSIEAKAAVVSGDIVWIEKKCGELTAEERSWIDRRLQMERW